MARPLAQVVDDYLDEEQCTHSVLTRRIGLVLDGHRVHGRGVPDCVRA